MRFECEVLFCSEFSIILNLHSYTLVITMSGLDCYLSRSYKYVQVLLAFMNNDIMSY